MLPGYDTKAEKRRIDTLAASIEESEEIEPIFVGLDDNGETWIMEGQHRTRALSQLGYSSVPARIVVDLSDAITASAQRDPSIVSQAIDRAIAREEGRRVSDLSRESATVKLRSLRRQLEAGKIDEGRFIFEVDQLSRRLDLKAADKALKSPTS